MFATLGNNALFRFGISPARAPRTFGQLSQGKHLHPQGLSNDLRWTAEVLALFAEEVTSFLSHKRRFERAYIRGDLAEGLSALDALEADHGLSLWLIARKALLLRRSGANPQGEYITGLLNSDHAPGVTGYITYLIGYRADPNVSPATFARVTERLRAQPDLPAALRSYLLYQLESTWPASVEECSGLLEFVETAALIDRFELFVDVLQYLTAAKDVPATDRATGAQVAARLAEIIPDSRLRLLLELEGFGDADALSARVEPDEADAYTEGDYDRAERLLTARAGSDPDCVHLLSLFARTRQRTGGCLDGLSPFLQDIVTAMATAYAFDDDSDAAISALTRETTAGGHRHLSACIRALLAAREGASIAATLADRLEAMNADRFTPLQLRNLPVEHPRQLMEATVSAHPTSSAIALQVAISEFGEKELEGELLARLPAERASLYQARALLRLSRAAEAVDLLRDLEHSDYAPTANDARRELFNAHVALNDAEGALQVVARAHLANQLLHPIFKLEPLLDGIEKRAEGPPFNQISLSICYHIFNRHHSDDRLGAQADAAEEFALASGVDLPSRLESPDGSDRLLFPLYLDQVCSAPVLDKFMVIDSVNDVEAERLEICRKLVEIDAANRQKYLDEIREITRRQVVRDRFEQVERTKIYVDTEGVKRQAEKTIREGFQRFLAALGDPAHGDEGLERMRQIKEIIAETQADGVKIHFPDLPANERDQLFADVVRNLMKLLISSQEYGLEAYLSTRVRHGTMGNQLRSAFETNAILTQKDDGRYVADHTWSDQLDLVDIGQWSWLAERLATFSEQLDATIGELVREKVQVRSEAFPDGLFTFTTYNYDTLQMQSQISADTAFETFVDKVVERFWSVLDDSLTHVREYINGKFLARVQELTDELQRDVNRQLVGVNVSALSDAIAGARTQMAVNVANVASWFTLAREMERPDYDFGVAVEVATRSIEVCHPTLGFGLQRADDVSFECRGRSLESLVYMLFTALDNAVEHSGLIDAAPRVTLSTTLAEGWLWLALTNSCAEVDDVDAANERLARRRESLERAGDLETIAATEGGSGYAKIIRILKHDLLARHALEFGYKSATEYEVRIGVEAKAIVK